MRAGALRALVLTLLLLLAPGCFQFRAERLPDAMRDYVEALVAGRYAEAYRMTQLAELAVSGASPLTLEHFESFYRSNPVRRYEVADVTRLQMRSIDAPAGGGESFYEIEIIFVTEDGERRRNTFSVQGDVLPTVVVDPVPILVRDPSGARSLLVDGVVTARPDGGREADGRFRLVLLQGRHVLQVGANRLVIETSPLRLLEGRGQVLRGPPQYLDLG